MTDTRNLKPMTRTIWKLFNDGVAAKNIEKMTGVNKRTVAMTIYRGRVSGDCKQKVKTMVTVFNKSPLVWGSVKQIKSAISADHAQWLFDEAENCGCLTVSEYISELILDAYEEAQHKKGTTEND
tara:strand:- start:297 stop:671 length:375 start_codon:yes stop_codon:yes gene_type:complete